MFSLLPPLNNPTQKKKQVLRIVIGGGALGLFMAYRIQQEFPESALYIASKTIPNKPIFIEDLNNNCNHFLFKSFINIFDLKNLKNSNNYETIIFYICLPPEEIDKSREYIIELGNKFCSLNGRKIVVFLNNGLTNYQYFAEYENKFNSFFIRSIVISGFVRIINKNNILVKNTSGKNIYYGYYNSRKKVSVKIFPKKYFIFKYKKNIFNVEKAKFITNFILGFFIKNKLLKNKEIYNLISPILLDDIFVNYSYLFLENEIKPKFIKIYFEQTIKFTGENINSISYAWYHGNTKPIEYFLAKLQELSYLSNSSKVKVFFEKLISLNNSSN